MMDGRGPNNLICKVPGAEAQAACKSTRVGLRCGLRVFCACYGTNVLDMRLQIAVGCMLALLQGACADCTKGDCKNGQGIFTWPDGQAYDGHVGEGGGSCLP
jgi:hypothetical protein